MGGATCLDLVWTLKQHVHGISAVDINIHIYCTGGGHLWWSDSGE